MAALTYRLIGGVWTCPGRPSVPPGAGGDSGFDPALMWTAATGFTDNGDGTWTSSGLTDNGDGTWTGTIS